MKFEKTDYDWSDWHTGLNQERLARYVEIVEAMYMMILDVLVEHHGNITMQAEIPVGIFAKGVRGDASMYAPIVALQAPFSWEFGTMLEPFRLWCDHMKLGVKCIHQPITP